VEGERTVLGLKSEVRTFGGWNIQGGPHWGIDVMLVSQVTIECTCWCEPSKLRHREPTKCRVMHSSWNSCGGIVLAQVSHRTFTTYDFSESPSQDDS